MISRLHPTVRFRLDTRDNPAWGWDVNVGEVPVIYHMDWGEEEVGVFVADLVGVILDVARDTNPTDPVSMVSIDDPEIRKWNAELAADQPFPL